jgi:hypothetical protein
MCPFGSGVKWTPERHPYVTASRDLPLASSQANSTAVNAAKDRISLNSSYLTT